MISLDSIRKASVKTRTTLNNQSQKKNSGSTRNTPAVITDGRRGAHLLENRTTLTSSAPRWLHGLICVFQKASLGAGAGVRQL